jgi:tetratricopeptide (TPR) repeat protein
VLLTRLALGIVAVPPSAGRAPILDDPTFGLQVATRAMSLLALPWPLRAMWDRAHLAPSALGVVAALAGVALFVAAARLAGTRAALACAAWLLVFLLPVSGLAPVDAAPFAERFLYLPSVGFCLVAGALASRRWTLVGALAVALAFAGLTLARSPVWRNEVALFESITADGSASAAMWDNLGQAYDARGRLDDAERAYRRGMELDPGRASLWNGLGALERRRGRLDAAESAFREAIRLDPAMPHPRFNLAWVCLDRGNRACAEEQRRVLESTAPEAASRIASAMAQP